MLHSHPSSVESRFAHPFAFPGLVGIIRWIVIEHKLLVRLLTFKSPWARCPSWTRGPVRIRQAWGERAFDQPAIRRVSEMFVWNSLKSALWIKPDTGPCGVKIRRSSGGVRFLFRNRFGVKTCVWSTRRDPPSASLHRALESSRTRCNR